MTSEQQTEGTDTSGESQDNELIQNLRQQLKEKDKELKARPDRASLEAEIRTELERESAIGEHLVALGHPKGMSAVLKDKLGEDDVTRNSVMTALQGIGYQVEVDDSASEDEQEETVNPHDDLAKVTELGAQVASAAQGRNPADAMKQISLANSQEDLIALSEKLGLSAKHV